MENNVSSFPINDELTAKCLFLYPYGFFFQNNVCDAETVNITKENSTRIRSFLSVFLSVANQKRLTIMRDCTRCLNLIISS